MVCVTNPVVASGPQYPSVLDAFACVGRVCVSRSGWSCAWHVVLMPVICESVCVRECTCFCVVCVRVSLCRHALCVDERVRMFTPQWVRASECGCG